MTLTYDALGRRVQKQTPTQTRQGLYDFKHLLRETDGSGVLQREYTFTPGGDHGDKVTITGFRGDWTFGDNLGTVNRLTAGNKMTLEEAAKQTWTYLKATAPRGLPGTTTLIRMAALAMYAPIVAEAPGRARILRSFLV